MVQNDELNPLAVPMTDTAVPSPNPGGVADAIADLPELIHVYQPTDEEGRNIGGKQVIKYRTPDELTQKLTEQNTLLIRKLRAETRKNRLGISDPEDIPKEAPKFDDPVEFKPRDLTDEERYQLARDLMDPAKAIDAQKKLFEASVGVSPETLRNTLESVQQQNMQIQAKQQADAFVAANPGYYKCQENFDAITSWMVRYDLKPVQENFQRAYDTLLAHGVIVQGPQTSPTVEPSQQPVSAPSAEPAAAPPRSPALAELPPEPLPEPPRVVPRIASGLSRDNSSNTGTPAPLGSDIVYRVVVDGRERVFVGLAALNAMPSDEYKRRLLHEPGFAAKVNKIDQEAQSRRSR